MSLTGCGHSAGDRPALLIIDTINDLEFEGAAQILDQAAAASLVMRDLRATVRRCGVPIIYIVGRSSSGPVAAERGKPPSPDVRRAPPSRTLRHSQRKGMAKLIAIVSKDGGKVWICPEHVIKLATLGMDRTFLTLTSGETFEINGDLDDIADAVNRNRADPTHP